MKAMKFIAIVMAMLVLPLASSKAQFKTSENKQAFEHKVATKPYEFQSTSTMAGSGSSLPISARNGFTVGADSPEDNNSSSDGRPGQRRIGGSGSGTGGNEAEENTDPQETPVGDGMWVLLLLAAGFAFGKWRYQMMLRRRKATA